MADAIARRDIRNIAIIAHVDHGKTTLVDALLSVAGAFRRGESHSDRAMDSGDLERERGITITSKPTALEYKGTQINIVDTPGHADFGGEVERVLNMVDAVLLLVDAFEGPMPQTRFVTEKAVARGLKVLLAVNKIDRDGSTPHKAVDATFDLLASVGASEEQLDFPVFFCSARERYAMADPDDEPSSMDYVLDFIVEHAPPPVVSDSGHLAMWVSTLDHDPYLGFLAIGRLRGGTLRAGERVALVRPDSTGAGDDDGAPPATCVEQFRVRKLLGFQGTQRFERDEVQAGDIVAVSGMSTLQVGDTLTTEAVEHRTVFPRLEVDPPTMTMRFRINDGPFAGLEGRWVTSRKIEERLMREIKSNVALQVSDTESRDEFEVAGRGELHLSVLIETMRREGYELCVSRPRVILRENATGETEEPYEHVVLRCDTEYSGGVIEALSQRMGELTHVEAEGDGVRTRLEFKIPARGLIGYRGTMLTDTRGTGVMSSVFAGYGPFLGARKTRQRGVLVALERGVTATYSLHRLQERGSLFVGPQVKVYAGMIVGESSREGDLIVNPCTAKKFSNVRAAGADEKLLLTPPRVLSLEEALAFIEHDELLEVTPESLRLRKRQLDHSMRKRDEKALKAASA